MNPLVIIAAIFIAIAFYNKDDSQKRSSKGGKDETLSDVNGNRGSDISGSKQSGNGKRDNRAGLRKKTRVGLRERIKQNERKTRVDVSGNSSPDSVGVEPIRSDKRSEPVEPEKEVKENNG